MLVTNYLKKILITIISLSVFLTPALAFASDDSDQEQAPLEVEDAPYYAVDLDHQRIMESAIELKAATATEYTTTDLYNLLYAALRGRSSSSSYSLVAMNADLRSLSQTLSGYFAPSIGASPLHALQDIHSILSGTALGLNPIATIADCLHLEAGDQSYSISDLTGMIWSLVQDLSSDVSSSTSLLSSSNSYLYNISNASIPWSNYGSYIGTSLGLDNNYLSSSSSNLTFYYTFNPSSNTNLPSIFYFDLPSYISVDNYTYITELFDVSFYFTNSNFSISSLIRDVQYHVVLTDRRNIRVFVYNLPVRYTSYNFTLKVSCKTYQRFDPSLSTAFKFLSSSSNYYYSVLDNFYLLTLSDHVSSLSDYLVSPAKQAAETASEDVIDDTLDNFTGSGGAAAKKSDTSSMKDVSVQVKSGLNGGGSSSNATDVLNPSSVSGQTFWIWFSTTTKNNVENPYPAPVVNNTRKSSDGDEILDTLSGYQEQLRNLLGGDSR